MEAIERLRFLAPGTGEREGGEKTQPFNRFPSHRVIPYVDYVYVRHFTEQCICSICNSRKNTSPLIYEIEKTHKSLFSG